MVGFLGLGPVGAVVATGVGGAVVVGGGLYVAGVIGPRAADPVEPAALIAQPDPEPQNVVPLIEEKAPEAAMEPEPVEDLAKTETAQPEAPAMRAPAFDLVRVEADGNAIIAGSAEPGSQVTVMLDGQDIGQGQAGNDGKFAVFLTVESSVEARVLTLRAEADGTIAISEDQIIVAPVQVAALEPQAEDAPVETAQTETAPEEPKVEDNTQVALVTEPQDPVSEPDATRAEASKPEPTVEAETDTPAASVAVVETAEPDVVASTSPEVIDTAAVAGLTAPEQVETPVISTQATRPKLPTEIKPPSPTLILASRDGVQVLQNAPVENIPEVMSTVALDAISYDARGEVNLAGRAPREGFVRVYLDNTPITTSRIRADGNWRVDLPEVDTGVYTLRVDEVDEAGQVTSRVETPFKREDPEVLAAANATEGEDKAEAGATKTVRVMTVQPGATLWAIAREQYGEGTLYVKVFEANKERIRNPDLIYPGQVFDIPASQ